MGIQGKVRATASLGSLARMQEMFGCTGTVGEMGEVGAAAAMRFAGGSGRLVGRGGPAE